MNNKEQLLLITILNKNEDENEHGKYEIQLNEVENIEKIKEDSKQKLGFENIDINKINFFFIDKEKDKILINEFNDLIEYSNLNNENNNLSIKLIAEISEDKNCMDNQNIENNIKNSQKGNKNIDDYKERMITELNFVIDKLKIKCEKYRDKIKKLTDNYEKIILGLKNVDSKNYNTDIKKKEKKNLTRQDIQFIKNKCNNCGKQNDNNIFQCVKCGNYYLCPACHKENIKPNKNLHEHIYFFEIKFPDKLMEKIRLKEKNDKEYYEAIDKFNDFLNGIFFDKNGNLTKQQFIANRKNIRIFKNLCNGMNNIKEDPFKYFEEYKKETINPKIESLVNEGKQEDIILLINEKLNLISNNLFKLVPTNEIKTNTNTNTTSNYHISINIQK